ncbi:MAG: hypothetical protein E7161_03000 [Firmicutes bacterium]|nr:hypothetical protein [Bacillota bacterium]
MNKEVKKIFVVLALYALSGGIFYNFQELWMAENNLSTQTIGIVYSLCALLSVSTIFLCSNLISKEKLKKFSCVLLLLKFIILLALFFLNNTGLNVIIKFLIMLDYVIDVEIWACIYPMITLITKNDKIYALKDLIYSFAYYGGIIFTSFLLGTTILKLNINFNFYNLIGGMLMLIAYLVLRSTKLENYYSKKENSKVNSLSTVLKIIKKDNVTQNYLMYHLTSAISYACINGMMITLLTANLNFSASAASYFKMILGIVAVFIGTLILEKLTLKNDYINFSIKFIGRLLFYILAFICNNKIVFLIAIVFMRLLSESYSHVSEAPYVNRFSNDNQLAFCNLREMIGYFSKAIGNLLCGIAITMGTRYNFLFAAIFLIPAILYLFNALRLRLKEKGKMDL